MTSHKKEPGTYTVLGTFLKKDVFSIFGRSTLFNSRTCQSTDAPSWINVTGAPDNIELNKLYYIEVVKNINGFTIKNVVPWKIQDM